MGQLQTGSPISFYLIRLPLALIAAVSRWICWSMAARPIFILRMIHRFIQGMMKPIGGNLKIMAGSTMFVVASFHFVE